MRILLDLQGVQTISSRNRGIGRYTQALAEGIIRNAGPHEIWILLNGHFPETVMPLRQSFGHFIAQDHIVVFSSPGPNSGDVADNRWRARTAELVREHVIADIAPDLIHVSSLFEGLGDDAVTSIGRFGSEVPTAVTLYDLIPYLYPDHYLFSSVTKSWYLNKIESLKRADLLLAISNSAANEAKEALGFNDENAVNISTAVDENFMKIAVPKEHEEKIRSKFNIRRPYLMYTGGIDWRKNVEGLITSYSRLPADLRSTHQLVIVCHAQSDAKARLEALTISLGLQKGEVILTGYVSDDELVVLYNLCRLFVFPSLHEGFGLPALEAMACGAAVIGSNTSSIPEVIGRADALFDPRVPEEITTLTQRALTDDRFLLSLRDHAVTRAKTFSWDRTAGRALAAFEALHERRIGSERSRTRPAGGSVDRPRLAMVTPLPPERTGIADYCAELLPVLSAHYRIEVISDQAEVHWQGDGGALPMHSSSWFDQHAHEFDRILYHFGNSSFHVYMFDLLQRHPGVVVLHDFFVSGVLDWIEYTGRSPHAFRRALYTSHGYPALTYERGEGRLAAIWEYPCNRDVLDRAAGTIVHSQFSVRAATQRYGKDYAADWAVIPQLRRVPPRQDRDAARRVLGLKTGDFLVCAFGHLGSTKLNDRLIDAWEASELARDRHCRLIFVGQNEEGDYGRTVAARLGAGPAAGRIEITGYADPDSFTAYLTAADAAVQLRCRSRGETSRAVLDCLAYGVPLIINANGAMAEYPEEILIKLADEFTVSELSEALERLHDDAQLRRRLAEAGCAWIKAHHDPEAVALQYRDAIEAFARHGRGGRYEALLRQIAAQGEALPEQELIPLATAIAANLDHRDPRQLLIDISELAQHDDRTGIRRVARSVLSKLLIDPPENCRVEPVYLDRLQGAYRYARQFTAALIDLRPDGLEDELVEMRRGDLFLGLDLNLHDLGAQRSWLEAQRRRGVKIATVVYDILKLRHPEWWGDKALPLFDQWLSTMSAVSDRLIATSKAVEDDLSSWLGERYPDNAVRPDLAHFHLGADLDESQPSSGLADNAEAVFARIGAASSFLMVGTLEPRNAHEQTLLAFELLWSAGTDVNLVIVGRQGWKVESLVERLRSHPELGGRLIWLDGISDEYLEHVYTASSALLAPSMGAGFGLLLIKAAQQGLPIIARDIPVFREVAGRHAYYFEGLSPADLANAIRDWLARYKADQHPKPLGMPWLTWAESADRLKRILFEG